MPNNPKSLANLIPLSKDDPRRNKAGRPKKPILEDLLIEVLSEPVKGGIPAAMAILLKLRDKALAGNLKAAEMLLDRTYGRVGISIDAVTVHVEQALFPETVPAVMKQPEQPRLNHYAQPEPEPEAEEFIPLPFFEDEQPLP